MAEDAVLHRTVRHDGCISVLGHVAGQAFSGGIGGHMKVTVAQIRSRFQEHINQNSR